MKKIFKNKVLITLLIIVLLIGGTSIGLLSYRSNTTKDTEKPEDDIKAETTDTKETADSEPKIEEASPVRENKAIIIIPGITGSDLVATADHTGFADVTIKEGEAVWIPQRLNDLVKSIMNGEDIDLSLISYDTVLSIIASGAVIEMDENGESIYPIAAKQYTEEESKGIFGTCNALYNSLKVKFSPEYDVVFFSYDWRYSIADAASELEKFIDEKGYDGVTLICHSMGGLVASYYLSASEEHIGSLDKMVTLGTPFGGAPKSLMALQCGRFFDTSIMDPYIKDIALNMPSVYELLPTPSYIDANGGYIINNEKKLDSKETERFIFNDIVSPLPGVGSDLNLMHYSSSLNSMSKLEDKNGHIINRKELSVYMIAGCNSPTVISIRETDADITHAVKSYAGDGTVPLSSAVSYKGELFDNPVYFADGIEHSSLLYDEDCIELITAIIEKGDDVDSSDYNSEKIKTKDEITLKDDAELEEEEITELFDTIFDLLDEE